MGKKVQCEQTEVSTTKDMNDRDILNDILLSLKNVSNNYSVVIDEMSNKKLYKEIYSIFNETKDAARKAYELAFSNGWYALEEADDSKITQAYDKANKQTKELA